MVEEKVQLPDNYAIIVHEDKTQTAYVPSLSSSETLSIPHISPCLSPAASCSPPIPSPLAACSSLSPSLSVARNSHLPSLSSSTLVVSNQHKKRKLNDPIMDQCKLCKS